MPEFEVRFYPTHKHPHPDELLSRYILEKLAEGKFGDPEEIGALPISPDAKFVIWGGSGQESPDGRPIDDWLEEGYVPLGIGGSNAPYDDHGGPDSRILVSYCKRCEKVGDDKKRWCVSDKIAYEYGIIEDPRVRRLLAYVHANDCHGDSTPFDLGRMVAALQRDQINLSPEDIYSTVKTLFFDVEFNQQTSLLVDAKAAFDKCAKVISFSVIRGGEEIEERRLVVLDGKEFGEDADHDRVIEYARMEWRPDKEAHHIVVRRQTNGTVQIVLHRDADFDMSASAAVLRYLELRSDPKSGGVIPLFEEMAIADYCPFVPNWHFQKETGHIFNGNRTHPDVPPTKIDLDTIVLVLVNLSLPKSGVVRRDWAKIDGLIAQATGNFQSSPLPVVDAAKALADSGLLRRPRTSHRREDADPAVVRLTEPEIVE